MVRPRSCRVIYYFDTPALGIRHQSFGRVSKEGVESEHCKEKTDSLPALPFPHAMTKQEAIEDEKGTENVVTDHLSKLIIDSTSDITPIDDYFLDESLLSLVQCLGLLKIIILLLQDFCQLIWITKTKESFWAMCKTFIGMTLTCSNIVLIKYFKDAFPTMR